LFKTTSGESIPFSAEMISVELSGDGIGVFDPEFLKHAASAVSTISNTTWDASR
jgi:hypothetical protein